MTMISHSKTSNTILACASERGDHHIRSNKANQDAVKVREYRFGALMAVADGVGSNKYAEYGSAAAVAAVHEIFCAYVRRDIPQRSITANITLCYRNKVKEKYREQAATTCIFAAHLYDEGLYLGQIGDGVCCGRINDNPFLLVEKTDDFSNIVQALSAKAEGPAHWKTRFIPASKIETIDIMLATDGVSEDILPGKVVPFSAFISGKLQLAKKRTENTTLSDILLNWETPLSQDDKTIACYHYQAK